MGGGKKGDDDKWEVVIVRRNASYGFMPCNRLEQFLQSLCNDLY
jgi:hypothetical protein